MDYKKVWEPFLPKARSAYFPSLITSLCLTAHVQTQANLKERYVQGCISTYDLERLVERVHELNQGEQEEPTKPDTEESTDEIETDSVTDTEEKNLIRNRAFLNQELRQKKNQSG
ncbi:hypothetical protein PVK06_035357 [Gossypium arboreum]|uniref:Uncharacterized protein n=1 Tax=Gossypium arboreum TaxID=29729 RepID=A0ABR0NGL3_GOSAR|nr:hypothetical protein PVK06_035357 [Gossypium arboreum]